MRNVIAWVGLLGVMAALGLGEPARPAATQPFSRPLATGVMPDEFRALLSRSVFARKGARQGALTSAVKVAGAGLALRGVVRDDGGAYTAIMEDPATHQIQKIENGATLAGGSVSHITLRGFQYEIGGKSIAVAIGQNLAGEMAIVAPPPAPAVVAGANGKNAPSPAPPEAGEGSPNAIPAAVVESSLPDANAADAVVHIGVKKQGRTSDHN